jgi:bacterioferritin-associated ferredoxin
MCSGITESQFNETYQQTQSISETIDKLKIGLGCRMCLSYINEEFRNQIESDNSQV